MTNNPTDVAALLNVAGDEASALDAVDAGLQRLRAAQAAKRELAQLPLEVLRAGLWARRTRGGDRP